MRTLKPMTDEHSTGNEFRSNLFRVFLSPGVKPPGRGADHSLSSNAEGKNGGPIPLLPAHLMDWCLITQLNTGTTLLYFFFVSTLKRMVKQFTILIKLQMSNKSGPFLVLGFGMVKLTLASRI
jgi:hypothetical protein